MACTRQRCCGSEVSLQWDPVWGNKAKNGNQNWTIPCYSEFPSLAVFWWECIYLDVCFHLKQLTGHPVHRKCVVWDNCSTPRAPCGPVCVTAWEKWALLLSVLFWQPPVPVDSRRLMNPQVSLCPTFVGNCGWLHHFHPVSLCHLISCKIQ